MSASTFCRSSIRLSVSSMLSCTFASSPNLGDLPHNVPDLFPDLAYLPQQLPVRSRQHREEVLGCQPFPSLDLLDYRLEQQAQSLVQRPAPLRTRDRGRTKACCERLRVSWMHHTLMISSITFTIYSLTLAYMSQQLHEVPFRRFALNRAGARSRWMSRASVSRCAFTAAEVIPNLQSPLLRFRVAEQSPAARI